MSCNPNTSTEATRKQSSPCEGQVKGSKVCKRGIWESRRATIHATWDALKQVNFNNHCCQISWTEIYRNLPTAVNWWVTTKLVMLHPTLGIAQFIDIGLVPRRFAFLIDGEYLGPFCLGVDPGMSARHTGWGSNLRRC